MYYSRFAGFYLQASMWRICGRSMSQAGAITIVGFCLYIILSGNLQCGIGSPLITSDLISITLHQTKFRLNDIVHSIFKRTLQPLLEVRDVEVCWTLQLIRSTYLNIPSNFLLFEWGNLLWRAASKLHNYRNQHFTYPPQGARLEVFHQLGGTCRYLINRMFVYAF